MNAVTINLVEEHGSDALITIDAGAKIYESRIKPYLAVGVTVSLDFAGVRILTPLFLGTLLGHAYRVYNADWLDEHVEFANVDALHVWLIQRVKENSRKYWNDKEYRERLDALDFLLAED